MRIGVQRPNELSATKYPFAEDSAFVSTGTASEPIQPGLLPCDFFSDVVVDAPDGINVVISELACADGRIVFSVVGSQGDTLETFSLESRDFDDLGRAFYASENAFVRVQTKYARSMKGLLGRISAESVSCSIGFDPHCTRRPENRLLAFDVHGDRVAGHVAFEPGYNISFDRPDYTSSNNLSLSAIAGSGAGRVPCGESEQADKAEAVVSGIVPDENGAVRIETDGCYSVNPLSDSALQITGQCTQCCSCEGDYLPLANAVNSMTTRLDTVYKDLSDINERHNRLIAVTKNRLTYELKPTFIAAATRDVLSTPGRSDIRVGVTFANVTLDDVRVLGMDMTVGNSKIKLFDMADASGVVSAMNMEIVETVLAVRGVIEVVRTMQIGTYAKAGTDAEIPEDEGVSVKSGATMYITSGSKCSNQSRESDGPYMSSAANFAVTIRYCRESDFEQAMADMESEGSSTRIVTEVFGGVFE